MLKELQVLGMTKNEARVYESLVKYGPCKAGIIINKTDLHRNLVYQSLERLVLQGYATKVIQKGIWQFQITDPASLVTQLKRKERVVTGIMDEIKTYQHKSAQQIVVYEGIESYREYWIRSLERIPAGTVDYAVGVLSNDEWIKLMGKSYQTYLELRLKKKIFWKTIHFNITPSELRMLKQLPDLTEYRLWQREENFFGDFNVVHDTVVLQAVTDPPRIIEIRDPDFVKIFQNYFDMMWEKAEPVNID